MARILAARMKPQMMGILQPSQYCGRTGTSIYEALATVRDAIAFAEERRKRLCILSIDFMEAFDRIEHKYLHRILQRYGFTGQLMQLIRNMYDNAHSMVQINGHSSAPFPIAKSIRQGCPLSMILYALCLNPFLTILADTLTGLQITPRGEKLAVVAYADDISIFISDPQDIPKIQSAIHTFTQASGARINIRKSKVLPLGTWDPTVNVLNIPYVHELRIMDITFGASTEHTQQRTWASVAAKVRGAAANAYGRDLCLTQRIWYTHTYILALLWHTAQILPPTSNAIRQITMAVAWYIWNGKIFKVPMTTLYKKPVDGGLGLWNIMSKCRTLFIARLWLLSAKRTGITYDWLRVWHLTGPPSNPPYFLDIPRALDYLRCYALERAYVLQTMLEPGARSIKKDIYQTLSAIHVAGIQPSVLRITKLHPTIPWATVWRNISVAWIEDRVRSTWYEVVQDLIATNVRLHKIRIATTDLCRRCGKTDHLQHRLTGCDVSTQIWLWTRSKIATYRRMEPKWIPETWAWAPSYQLWPPKRHNATTWILAHMTYYVITNQRTPSMQDYIDYMRRSRWKFIHQGKGRTVCGHYLDVLCE
jgi:hypothetical protein